LPMKKTSCSRASVDHLHRPRDHPRHPPSFKFHGVAPTERPCAHFPRSQQSGPPSSTALVQSETGVDPASGTRGVFLEGAGLLERQPGNEMEEWSDTIYVAGLPTDITEDRCAPNAFPQCLHAPPGARREEESEGNMALDGTQRRYRVAACPAPRGATDARRRSGRMRRGAHLEGVVIYFVVGVLQNQACGCVGGPGRAEERSRRGGDCDDCSGRIGGHTCTRHIFTSANIMSDDRRQRPRGRL